MCVGQHLAANRETIQVGVVPANNIALCLYCVFIIMHPILINRLTQSHNGTTPQKLGNRKKAERDFGFFAADRSAAPRFLGKSSFLVYYAFQL